MSTLAFAIIELPLVIFLIGLVASVIVALPGEPRRWVLLSGLAVLAVLVLRARLRPGRDPRVDVPDGHQGSELDVPDR